jgi:hypothetical protein
MMSISRNNGLVVRSQVEQLSLDEQLDLLKDLTTMITHQVAPKPKHSILELKGLGKEIWQDIEAQEYINQERDSWIG